MKSKMNLTETPEIRTWPETHYVFVEKIGPFQETAQAAWGELHAQLPEFSKTSKVERVFSQYKIDPKRMVYRAGVSVAEKPATLPPGFAYERAEGGKFVCFTLTDNYSRLPEACGYAFNYVEENKVARREAFNVEHYVNDPKTTPSDQCITEILIPTI